MRHLAISLNLMGLSFLALTVMLLCAGNLDPVTATAAAVGFGLISLSLVVTCAAFLWEMRQEAAWKAAMKPLPGAGWEMRQEAARKAVMKPLPRRGGGKGAG